MISTLVNLAVAYHVHTLAEPLFTNFEVSRAEMIDLFQSAPSSLRLLSETCVLANTKSFKDSKTPGGSGLGSNWGTAELGAPLTPFGPGITVETEDSRSRLPGASGSSVAARDMAR